MRDHLQFRRNENNPKTKSNINYKETLKTQIKEKKAFPRINYKIGRWVGYPVPEITDKIIKG